jgi:rare lipoprotein A
MQSKTSSVLATSFILYLALQLSACSWVVQDGGPAHPVDVSDLKNPVPKFEPVSRSGNPSSYTVRGKRYVTLKSSKGFVQRGIASWYGRKFHGRKTSNGETYDMYKMTAAHKTLPLPSYVTVKNLNNGKEIVVRVNDRGPFVSGRVIDLSYAAALKLGIGDNGTARVEIRDASVSERSAGIKPDHPSFYLQLGSFRDPENAYQLQQRVSELTLHSVNVLSANSSNEVLHRVRVGPFTAQDVATQLSAQLIEQGVIAESLLITQ